MITKEKLEEKQVWYYGVSIVAAVVFGLTFPQTSSVLDKTISIVIGILMYSMFTQIPFLKLKEAFSNRRFIYALLFSNYIVVPLLVWLLVQLLPNHAPLLLGIYLVLLTPCIDYVIVFTHLGKGNEKLTLVSTPLLFITQMLLLPLYLWIFMGKQAAEIVNVKPFIEAFLVLIIIPLVLAVLTQLWARSRSQGASFLIGTAWLPVPFMALTLFVVVTSQISKLYASFNFIMQAIPVFIAFMAIIPFLARFVAQKIFRLDIGASRALIFSSGTRNSLVVLPFALALPAPLNSLVSAVIVTQTIVELVGELVYVRLVPEFIIKDKKGML